MQPADSPGPTSSEPQFNKYELRARRADLLNRLDVAAIAAGFGGLTTAIFAIWAVFSAESDWQTALYLGAAAGMQFLMAYQIRERHEFAAGSMVFGYVIALVLNWLHAGSYPGLISIGVLALFVRGFLAAIELTELDERYGPEVMLS